MKKRLIALLMTCILCITMVPSTAVFAAQQETSHTDEIQLYAASQTYSDWALNDLVTGDTYGIYPASWYTKDMTAPITQGQLRVLLSGLRYKLIKTDCVTASASDTLHLQEYLTVKEVLKLFYDIVAADSFSTEFNIKDMEYLKFMTDYSIYTGKNGEQTLDENCSMQQACVMASRLVTTVYDLLNASSKGFFYEAKANGNTVYMLGSIHMASYDVYPLSEKIVKAFQQSNALAVEVNLLDLTGAYDLLKYAQYTDGTVLKDHVSADTYQKIVTLAGIYGYSEQQISTLKTWYLYSVFNSLSMTASGNTEDAQLGTALGIDMNFLVSAMLSNKPVYEVEGYEVQGKLLDSFSDGLAEYLLNSTMDSINGILSGKTTGSTDSLNTMLALWKNGDEENYKAYTSFEYEYKDIAENAITDQEKNNISELKEKLFTQRDQNMADYIDNLLKSEGSNTFFVVVGSSHYVSDNDVIDLLTKKGYEVNQIK